VQPCLELWREALALREAVAGGQRIAEGEDADLRRGRLGKHQQRCESEEKVAERGRGPISRHGAAARPERFHMSAPVIALQDVALTLEGNAGPVNILRGISLEVRRGETLGLVGPSGSGKSSLLMLMGGLESATAGRVSALGQDLTAMGEDALARFRRDHMGVVFQSFHLIPTMTAVENVATPLELAGDPDAFGRAAAELDAMGLGTRLDHYPAQLSGGEQQRVALARAAVGRPEILLADEPTGNLDGATGETIIRLLFELRDRHGATLVLVTHAPEIAGRCDRVIRLRDGVLEPYAEAAE
jgi:putative ABC transport system ATP-binding protein